MNISCQRFNLVETTRLNLEITCKRMSKNKASNESPSRAPPPSNFLTSKVESSKHVLQKLSVMDGTSGNRTTLTMKLLLRNLNKFLDTTIKSQGSKIFAKGFFVDMFSHNAKSLRSLMEDVGEERGFDYTSLSEDSSHDDMLLGIEFYALYVECKCLLL